MIYLVTGGCGFLGSNTAKYLLDMGHKVIVFDNLYRFGSEENLNWLIQFNLDFEFIKGDIRNHYEIEPLIQNYKPDVIFHFAGQVAMTTSIDNPLLDFEINAKGTLNVLEAVRKFSIDSIVCFSSTNKVYGDLEYIEYNENETRYIAKDFSKGFNEKLPLDFHSPYGCSKGTADQYMQDYHRIFGLKTIVFRHSSIFGNRQYSTKDQGWVGWFCNEALITKNLDKNHIVNISGDGKQVRDILFDSDLIDCYQKAILNIKNTAGQVYNIGGGYENSYSLNELFNELENILNIKMNITKNPWRKSDQKVFIADIKKAQIDFGWVPKIDKRSGLKLMIEWVNSINSVIL